MEGINNGTILNQRYEIIECVGIGGMAEVFKAQDLETGEYVALKILKREHSMESDFIKRFNNEAEAAAQLQHQNIVSIYGIGQEADIHYIIMEFIEGVTLKDYIDAYQSVSWQDALKTAAQVLLAMDHAHSKHIIHRDIKPLNIMMGNDGSVKLADFGIARALNSGTIHAGDSAGSVHYFSPEQARGGYVDERSDIYSLGITLFEMLVGVVPFDGESNVSVALKHIDGNFIPPHDIDPEIPIGVSDLVVIATRKDPGMRFQSARDMIAKIRKVIENPHEGLIETFTEDPAAVVAAVLSEADEEKRAEGDALKYTEKDDVVAITDVEFDEQSEEEVLVESKGQKIRRRIALALTYIAASVFAFLAIVWVLSSSMQSQKQINSMLPVRYSIQNYVGHYAEPVVYALKEAGMVVVENHEVNDEYPKGYIFKQSVMADVDMEPGDEIVLSIAKPEKSYVVEDFANKDIDTARRILEEDNGLNIIINKVASKNVKENLIVRTMPRVGSIVEPGDDIVLYVSSGTILNMVQVPNLVGMSESDARELIQKNNLIASVPYPLPGEDITDMIAAIEAAKKQKENEENKDTSTDVPAETPGDDNVSTDSIVESDGSSVPTDEIESAVPTESYGESTGEPGATLVPDIDSDDIPSTNPDDENDKILAENKVVSQYPPAGEWVYKWETVDIFLYDVTELMYLEDTETLIIQYPSDKPVTNQPVNVKVKFTYEIDVEFADKDDERLVKTMWKRHEDFPLAIEVPFAYGTKVTKVDIYIDDMVKPYKTVYVYKND